ncbi:MAG: hypothetical protein WC509_02085 [Candidatus Izemoplasmatales bacterium]
MANVVKSRDAAAMAISKAAAQAAQARKRTTSAKERFDIKERYFHRAGYSRAAIATWERIVDGSFVPDPTTRRYNEKRIDVIRSDGKVVTYQSQREAAAALHVSPALITLYLQEKIRNPMFIVRRAGAI